MPKVYMRAVRADWRKSGLMKIDSIVRRHIENVLDQKVKASLVKSHEKVVEDWKNQPEFKARKYIKPNSMKIVVFPAGEHKQIWYWVDRGTRPHQMPAVTDKLMVFRAGGTYVPKTMAKPARTVTGGGFVKGGDKVFASRRRAFLHPGSEGRNFTKQIADDLKPHFQRWIENAFRAAAREVNR